MDTRKLKYFLAVVDHGGFNRAAEHLLIAQPSLSQTIAGLGVNNSSLAGGTHIGNLNHLNLLVMV
jgi:hypothetical protein